jgi:ribose 5-phosphate isomerase B
MTLIVGSDHAGFALKCEIRDWLKSQGHKVLDVGTQSEASCDYPVFGKAVAEGIVAGKGELGIAICGTGAGICMAASKVHGCRAVCCSEPCTARLARQHNNANVLCFGARVVGKELAKMIVTEFITAQFEGGRHERRVNMIEANTEQ